MNGNNVPGTQSGRSVQRSPVFAGLGREEREYGLREQHHEFVRIGHIAHNRHPVGIPMGTLRHRRSRRSWRVRLRVSALTWRSVPYRDRGRPGTPLPGGGAGVARPRPAQRYPLPPEARTALAQLARELTTVGSPQDDRPEVQRSGAGGPLPLFASPPGPSVRRLVLSRSSCVRIARRTYAA